MTDAELLRAAAKAAGIQIVGPVEKYIAQPNREHIGGFIVRNDKGGDSAWNPLGDDGDALRLAVKLQLAIFNEHVMCGVAYCSRGDTENFQPVETEEKEGDTVFPSDYAATRRAIVLAAAQIEECRD